MANEDANAVNTEAVAEPVTTESAPVDNQADDGANAQVSDDDNFFAEEDAKLTEGTKKM
jgi:hypothetical protein